MSKVILMGECMAELLQIETNLLQQSFAGDFFNMAVYLKRAYPAVDTGLLTAVGQDSLSQRMLDFFAKENLNTEFVCHATDKIPGLYWIQTDAKGERSFTYWRENSAARQVMNLLVPKQVNALLQADWFFFSGISLAVVDPKDREKFWLLLSALKASGVKIVFDPNYRARLWANQSEAKTCFAKALEHTDMLLPGIEDFQQLYGMTELEDIKLFLADFKIAEAIIKNGPHEVCCIVNSEVQVVPITPVVNVVDTTSAGDSFNGVYLGARISGLSIEKAIELAAKSAGLVIQHKGAIIPAEIFSDFWMSISA